MEFTQCTPSFMSLVPCSLDFLRRSVGLRTEELVSSGSFRIQGFLRQKDIIFFLFLLYLSRFEILLQKHASVVGTRPTRSLGMTKAYNLTRGACDGLHLVFLRPGGGKGLDTPTMLPVLTSRSL